MADKSKILDIDISSIISNSSILKKELDDLRKKQAELKKENDTSSATYVKLEASIKKVSSEYNNNQKQLSNLAKTGGDFLTVNEKINASLVKEINTIEEARQNVAELTKLRNQLNLNDKEQLKIAEQLNQKIDKNNEFIKENVSQLEKQKIGIGDYASGIKAAIADTGLWSGELMEVKAVFDSFAAPLDALKGNLKDAYGQIRNASVETEGLTKAQKAQTVATNIGTGALKIFQIALAAIGIGIIIAAVALLIGYLRTFDPVMDRVEQVFSAVGAVVEVVAKAVLDFVKGLTDVGATIEKVGKFLRNPIASMKEFGNEMRNAAKAAADLKKAQQDLEDFSRLQEVSNAKASQQIKELMLQSKNRTLSEEERLKLLEQANKIEQTNYNQRAKLAEAELDLAQRAITTKAGITDEDIKRLKKEGTAYAIALKDRINVTDEEVQAIQDAEIAKIKILEESTTIREKIQNQSDALEEKRKAAEEKRIKEIQEARAKAIDKALAQSKAELDLFIAQQGFKAKSLEEEFILEQTLTGKRLDLLKKEYDLGRKSKTEYETEKLNIQNEFLRKQAELTIDYARRALDEEIALIPESIKKEEFLTELILQQEQKRLDLIAEKNKNFQELRLEQGIIDEQTYQDEIKRIQDETQIKKDEAALKRAEAEKERQAIDLANQRAYEDILFQQNLEIQLARLEQQRLLEVESARKTGADIALINQKYAAAKKDLETKSTIAQISNARNAIQEVGTLLEGFFGESKILSAGMASVDTFLMAQKAYLSQLIPGDPTSVVRATVAAVKAGAFGALNVAKILGVKFADGGILQGPSHAQGGIPTPFGELEGDEAIINKKSTSMFGPLLSAINVAGGGKAFAQGGIASMSSIASSIPKSNTPIINYDELATKIADANRSLPPNKLSMEEFSNYYESYTEIITGANHG